MTLEFCYYCNTVFGTGSCFDCKVKSCEDDTSETCNVCGLRIRSLFERLVGMCERCANDWQRT